MNEQNKTPAPEKPVLNASRSHQYHAFDAARLLLV